MRSIRSGIKKLELVKANLAVLKKIAMLIIVIFIIIFDGRVHIIFRPRRQRDKPRRHWSTQVVADNVQFSPQKVAQSGILL